jgi:hypothetical protein
MHPEMHSTAPPRRVQTAADTDYHGCVAELVRIQKGLRNLWRNSDEFCCHTVDRVARPSRQGGGVALPTRRRAIRTHWHFDVSAREAITVRVSGKERL